MKISVFAEHLFDAERQSGLPLARLLRTVRGYGIAGAEVDYERLAENPSLPRLLRENGLEIACVYAFFDFARRDETERVRTVLKTLRDCGVCLFMAIPGFFSPGGDRENELSRMYRGMAALIESAGTVGIRVCLEDFDDRFAPFSTADGLNGFLTRLPELGCAFDTGNFCYSEESETEAFRLLRDRIVHLHCKDRRFSPNRPGEEEKRTVGGRTLYPAAVGAGALSIEPIVRELLRAGYQGWFAIEHFGSADQFHDIKESAENLKRWDNDYRNRME